MDYPAAAVRASSRREIDGRTSLQLLGGQAAERRRIEGVEVVTEEELNVIE